MRFFYCLLEIKVILSIKMFIINTQTIKLQQAF